MFEGSYFRALLDTGCDISVIGARVLPGLSYQECTQKLYAANSTVVPIAGSTELQYNIEGVDMKYEVLVSEAIDEIIFGADWLKDHNCIWDFSSGVLYIRDGEKPRPVTLRPVNRRPCLRRIYASSTTEIPSRSQIDIPVKSVWTMLPSAAVDWLVEPREHLGGVLIARTLLSPHEQQSYVRILNCSPNTCTIPAGELLATAEAVESQNISDAEQSTQTAKDYTHVQCLIDELPSFLTLGERQEAIAFI